MEAQRYSLGYIILLHDQSSLYKHRILKNEERWGWMGQVSNSITYVVMEALNIISKNPQYTFKNS